MKNKKIILYIILLLAVVISIFVIRTNNQSSYDQGSEVSFEPVTIKIADRPERISSFPIFVAQEQGFFAENNITVEIEMMRGGPAIQALLSNEIDYSSVTPDGITAALKGVPVKQVVTFTDYGFFALFSSKESIEDVEKISIGSLFSTIHYVAARLIHEYNLSAEIVPIGDLQVSSRVLLEQGVVDGNIVSYPAPELQGAGFNVLKRIDFKMSSTGLIATENKIENNPEEVRRVISSILKGVEFIKNNPDETKEMIFSFLKFEKTEMNIEIVDEIYSMMVEELFDTGMPENNEGMINLLKFSKAENFNSFQEVENQIVTQEDIDKTFDFRFLK